MHLYYDGFYFLLKTLCKIEVDSECVNNTRFRHFKRGMWLMKLNVVSSEHNVCYCLFIFHCCHSHRSGLHGLCKDRKWKNGRICSPSGAEVVWGPVWCFLFGVNTHKVYYLKLLLFIQPHLNIHLHVDISNWCFCLFSLQRACLPDRRTVPSVREATRLKRLYYCGRNG